jgi:hypothetical protein
MKRMNLVKSSLLLWDQVEFIVPDRHYRPHYQSKSVAEAMELIGVMHYPDLEEKEEAHQKIEALASSGLPESFFFTPKDPAELYEIYPDKLLNETWRLLIDAKLAGSPLANRDYPLAQHAGLGVMSILADCCAGDAKRRITDRGAAYATLVGTLAGRAPAKSDREDAEGPERLVGVTLDVLNAGSIPIERLINLRKSEMKEGGHTLRKARHNYVDKIEGHLKAVAGMQRNGDRRELDRVFAQSVRDDLSALREGLKIKAKDAIYTSEMYAAVVAAAGTLATVAFAPVAVGDAMTLNGAAATIGGLLSAKNNYMKERIDLIAEHPMAYLYEAKGGLRL